MSSKKSEKFTGFSRQLARKISHLSSKSIDVNQIVNDAMKDSDTMSLNAEEAVQELEEAEDLLDPP